VKHKIFAYIPNMPNFGMWTHFSLFSIKKYIKHYLD